MACGTTNASEIEEHQQDMADSKPSHHEPLEIVPDCRGCKNQRVNPVEDSSMPGQDRSGILYAGAAFECRLEYISYLPRDATENSHGEHVRQPDLHPISEQSAHQQSTEQIRSRSLQRLVRTPLWRHLHPSEA